MKLQNLRLDRRFFNAPQEKINKKVDRSGEKMYYKCNKKCTINVTIEKREMQWM